jgi:CDP-diacylglycerol--glycerol-3-phosphate 3-phosphatidyltransferase
VAVESNAVSAFGAFWDSVIDRFSDIALFIGLIYLYSERGRTDYVMVTAIAMLFAIMTSYTRARAESLIPKCKVGFMERPERIVLFWIGAFTNRMAAVMWVILVLSIFTVADRIILTYRELRTAERRPIRKTLPIALRELWNAFYWTYERATWQYDLMVVAILSFVWLTPPGWLGDPMAPGPGLLGWMLSNLHQ